VDVAVIVSAVVSVVVSVIILIAALPDPEVSAVGCPPVPLQLQLSLLDSNAKSRIRRVLDFAATSAIGPDLGARV
jgi:hypothetical protein